MFSHTKTVLFLTKGIAHITIVLGDKEIVKTTRQEWSTRTLPALFQSIRTRLGHNPIRVLLADEFSYILELTIPPHILNVRLNVEQQLKTHIPEVLHSNEWDFREIATKSKEKKVLVFAPVKYVYDALLKASDTSGLHIETIEPVQIAGKRNKNPVVGLAMKQDLKGKDEEVLNVIPTHYVSTQNTQADEEETTRKNASWKMWVTIIGVLVLIGGCAFVIYSQFTKPRTAPLPVETPTPTKEAMITPEASESGNLEEPTSIEEPELNISLYKVQVLNGSGIIGTSNEVKGLLEKEGFGEISTGNADNYNYTKTIIKRKSTVPEKIASIVSEILTEYDIEETDLLTSDESYDVLIIVGRKL